MSSSMIAFSFSSCKILLLLVTLSVIMQISVTAGMRLPTQDTSEDQSSEISDLDASLPTTADFMTALRDQLLILQMKEDSILSTLKHGINKQKKARSHRKRTSAMCLFNIVACY